METNIQNTELEQMRSQINLLQQKLEHQEIVSDRLIRESMKDHMKWIKTFIIFEAVLMAPICIIGFLMFKLFLASDFNISWLWLVAMTLLLIADIVMDYRVNVTALEDSDFNRDSLNNTAVKLIEMKKARMLQTKWGIVLILAVFAWFLIEAWLTVAPSEDAHTLLLFITIGMVIGSLLGVALGIYVVKRMQRTNDEMIEQIHDITKEQE